MATSSIFAEVRIDTPSRVKKFMKALKKAEKNAKAMSPLPEAKVADKAWIREMMSKKVTK